MDLRSYLHAIRRGWLVVLLLALAGGVLAGVAYYLTPPSYSSRVDFYVSTPLPEGANAQSAGQFAEARVNSYVRLLTSDRLAELVVEETAVGLSPADVSNRIAAEAELNTVVLRATVTDSTPERATVIAEGVASTFGDMVDELDNQGRADAIVVINVVSGPTAAVLAGPDWRRYALAGIGAGLLAGIAVAVLRYALDTTVHSDDVVQELTGNPVLGSIPFDAGTKESPLIVGDELGTPRAEAYRQLRTNLHFLNAVGQASVIMVSSAVPGEGKTTIATNLALSFVERGEKVLLMECDLRLPAVSNLLGLEGSVGLTDVLVDHVRVDDVLQVWGQNLTVLAAGPLPPNPSELLGGTAMAQLMAELRTMFDRIVIDTPPLIPVTDAAVLSSVADGTLLVTRHGRTNRAQLAAAAQSLEGTRARILGTVFNMRRATRAERRLQGDSGYYYVNG